MFLGNSNTEAATRRKGKTTVYVGEHATELAKSPREVLIHMFLPIPVTKVCSENGESRAPLGTNPNCSPGLCGFSGSAMSLVNASPHPTKRDTTGQVGEQRGLAKGQRSCHTVSWALL